MKLLIITQKVDMNDDNLGSFHEWLKKLAEKADIFVIGNYVGKYDLPENVKVFSLGKEIGVGRLVKNFQISMVFIEIVAKS